MMLYAVPGQVFRTRRRKSPGGEGTVDSEDRQGTGGSGEKRCPSRSWSVLHDGNVRKDREGRNLFRVQPLDLGRHGHCRIIARQRLPQTESAAIR
jgi:hypothetical protein